MKEKLIYLIFSFLLLLSSLLAVYHYRYYNNEHAPIIVPIIIFLTIFCMIIMHVSKDEKNARSFTSIISLISIYLLLDLFPFPYLDAISFIIISFLPYFIYKFFITFNSIPNSHILKLIEVGLFYYSFATATLLLINFEQFYYLILIEILLSILGCTILYWKEKDRLSTNTRKEQTFLTKSLIISLSPFILSYSLLNNILPTFLKFYSLIFILLIPVTVGVILIKRNAIRLNRSNIIANLATHIFCVSFFFILSNYFFHVSIFALYFIIMIYFIVLCIFHLKNGYLNNLEIMKVKQAKKDYQKERIELIQTITKEKTLSSISSLISKLLVQNYGIKSYLVVWKDKYNPYILSSRGYFSGITLTSKIIEGIKVDSREFQYQHNRCDKFTFYKKNQAVGWFVVSKEKFSKLSVDEYESINELVGVIGEIILENEKMYDIKQEAMKIESLSYDEYVNYEYLNRVQNFHKDFSFFIHDNVLQNILALKNLTESLQTEQIEIKNLILETFDNLNKVFRDKIFELYPSTIEKVPLSQSIRTLCDKLNYEQDAICIRFYCPNETCLKKEERFHVYRIIQELIVNALKHSQATEISVVLIQNETYFQSSIEDNGVGFDYSKIKLREYENKHFGILSINQEVNSLNGKMKIVPVEPSGTKFIITLPVTKEDNNESIFTR
ncbi:sensor histidine kinase [Listeria booriae]|uniref:sensor histidine kinase n=1 Tax=Listeria booriae TaxID=1552123 RepID=UPI001624697C|nr:ATP-binding protein [Listeria booriae]MBC2149775.1 ATP-binding protein [Listeria booriae]